MKQDEVKNFLRQELELYGDELALPRQDVVAAPQSPKPESEVKKADEL